MSNIYYPFEGLIKRCEGKVFVQFVVDWDRQVKDVTVLKTGAGCDAL